MTRSWARSSSLLVLAIATITGVAFNASPSAAAAAVQVCAHMSGSGVFAPGLTSTAKNNTLRVSAAQSACTPSARTGGSGSFTATLTLAKGSCIKLAAGNLRLAGTGATTWATNQVSKYTLTLATGSGSSAPVATITGRVTSGLFSGHKVTGAVRFASPGNTNCTTKPLKQLAFTSSKSFVIT